MTGFEIAVTLVLIWYGVIFGIVCAGLFSRTKINKSAIEVTNKVLDCHNLRIDGVINRMDFLVQLISDRLEEYTTPKSEDDRVFKAYCYHCDSDQEYDIRPKDETYHDIYGKTNISFNYVCMRGFCKKCGNQINLDEIDDANNKIVHQMYLLYKSRRNQKEVES